MHRPDFVRHKPGSNTLKALRLNEYNINSNLKDRASTAAALDLASIPQDIGTTNITVLHLKEGKQKVKY